MKLTALLAAMLLFNTLFAQEVLNNTKLIELHKAGFSKEILKSKIQSSPTNFDVTIEGMMKLKKAGVSDEIINIMIAHPAQSSMVSNTATIENNNQSLPPRALNLPSGIYYKNPKGEYLEIDPSVLTGTKSNNAAQIFISGLINSKLKASLSGKQSSSKIFENTPTLLFVFDTSEKKNLNNDNNSNAWFANVRSPKEFIFVKMNVNANSREITLGKSNVVNSNAGIDDKYVYPFNFKKISNGCYEMSPQVPLSDGEYCIMFAQGIKNGESTKVFDFSIKK